MTTWIRAAAVAVLLLSAACEAAEKPAPAARSATSGGLCLTIDLPRGRYEVWESIDVTATLTNAGKAKLVVSPGCVGLKFEGAGAQFLLYPMPIPPWSAGAQSLGPGRKLAVAVRGLRHGGGVWQLKPGTYKVAAEYALSPKQAAQAHRRPLPAGKVWVGTLKTPSVRLEVAPTSPIQQRIRRIVEKGRSAEGRRQLLAMGPEAEAELLRMFRGDRSVHRPKVIRALGMVRSKAAVGELIALLAGKDAMEQHAAVWALGEIGDKRACVPLCRLIEKLPAYATLRAEALAALQHVADKRAVPTLSKLAASDDYKTAGRALGALQAVTGEDYVGRMVASLFPKDRKPHEAWGSKEAYDNFLRLRHMGPIAADALLKAFETAADEHRAKRLAKLLHLLLLDAHHVDRIVPALLRKLIAKDPMVRKAMCFYLKEQKTDAVIDALIARLGDDHDSVREAAAGVLGALKVPRAAGPLLKMMRDHSRWSGRCAVVPLSNYEDPKIEAAIMAEYEKGKWAFRYRCLWAFGFRGSDKAAQWLADLAKNAADPRERTEAANSLARRKELKARK